MARKTSGGFGKVVAVVFTSVVAPVLVHVAVRDSNGDEAPPRRAEPTPATREAVSRPADDSSGPRPAVPPIGSAVPALARPAAVAPPTVILQVVVQGAGKTPEEALQQALRTALDRAIAVVDAAGGATARAALPRDGGNLIRGWKDIGGRREWKLRGTVYHREVAVDVNREALLACLRAGQPAGGRGPAEGWQRVVAPVQP